MNKVVSMWDFARFGGNEQSLIMDLAGMWIESPEEFEIFCNSVQQFKSEFQKVKAGHIEPNFENMCSAMKQNFDAAEERMKNEKLGENIANVVTGIANLFSKN